MIQEDTQVQDLPVPQDSAALPDSDSVFTDWSSSEEVAECWDNPDFPWMFWKTHLRKLNEGTY